MGVKLMTGATGEQNIHAADDRECLAGITGLDSYVFPTGSQLKATLVDANTVTIGTGAGSLQGSRFRCSTTTTVNIQSGMQGQFRHDIIGLHFSRETSGREGLEFQVLTGEPAASEGAATDPAYTAGDLLKGDAEAFMPLYRVKLSGINAADPEPMFSVLTPLATLEDSVSKKPELLWRGMIHGSGSAVTSSDVSNHKLLGFRFNASPNIVIAKSSQQLVTDVVKYNNGIRAFEAKFTISGNTVSFSDISFAQFSCNRLGESLMFNAGDITDIAEIWGL